jgi:cytosine/adenosine deaminase-related metal-dependent hydrolase
LIRYRAAWVLPISRPPIEGGVITIENNRIVSVDAEADGSAEDLGRVAVLPGLVNAHTHLELSWMRGRISPASSMPEWVGSLMALRRTMAREPSEPIVGAITEARATGTCLVGDITNTLASYGPLGESEMYAAVFRELLGFGAQDPDRLVDAAIAEIADLIPHERLRPTVVPHAPFSVSPALFQSIARRANQHPISVHLGESAEEIRFLRDGSGAWRSILDSVGAWNPSWTAPACGAVEYLDRLGLLGPNLIAVHGVQFTDDELSRLAAARATVVTCPRSNRWTGAGTPPIDRFYASGVRVAIGTDSLASVQDLNVFSELAEVRRLAPHVSARALLASATQHGAQALGFGSELGTLEPGKHARMIAVDLPAHATDVEECLLRGVQADQIRWL